MTKGNKNILKLKSENLNKFWDLNKLRKLQNSENATRTYELMSNIAKEIIANNDIDESYNYYSFIKNVANGYVVTNKFGKKLYFKMGDEK